MIGFGLADGGLTGLFSSAGSADGAWVTAGDSCSLVGVTMGNVYFLRIGLIRFNFCIVKLSGCICSNSLFHSDHSSGSAFRNATESIFFDVRYVSKSTALI